MTDKTRRGLGRGLGSLIPSAPGPIRPDETGQPGPPGDEGPRGGMATATLTARPRVDALDALHALPDPVAAVPDGLQPVDGARFAELDVDSIAPNPRQPRQVFDEDAMAELVASIGEVGLLQPVVVRPLGEGRFELVMGERRLRATRAAGLATIPAIVRETEDDALLRDALLENLHRAQLNPLEEAAAYQQLLDDFGCTHEELAGRLGRSRPQVTNTLRLLKLSPPVQRRVAAGVLSAGHARTLLGVEDPTAQDRLAERVVAEGISVRGLEELVAVGPSDQRPARVRRTRLTAPALEDLAERLSDLYETRVRIDLGRRKGRITVEFASLPDLERIVAVMDPTYSRRSPDTDGTDGTDGMNRTDGMNGTDGVNGTDGIGSTAGIGTTAGMESAAGTNDIGRDAVRPDEPMHDAADEAS